MDIRSICVFSGSADNLAKPYLQAAFDLGSFLARQGYRVVFGAGKTGLMGALAEGVLSANGEIIGVVPVSLNTPVLIHAQLSELIVTQSIHERKMRMHELADAFIALPGGYGTMEELFETLTWAQIGLHQKPVGLLNVQAFFDPLFDLIDHMAEEGFIFSQHEQLFVSDTNIERLVALLKAFRTPDELGHWVNR